MAEQEPESKNPHIVAPGERDRRYLPRPRRNHRNVIQLWEHHREIVRRAALGESSIAISVDMGVSERLVNTITASPLGRAKMEELVERMDEAGVDIGQRIRKFTPVAMQLLEDIISGNVADASTALRAKTAEAYVSRAGYGTIAKSSSISTTLSRNDIEEMKARARGEVLPLAAPSGHSSPNDSTPPIDTTYEVVE